LHRPKLDDPAAECPETAPQQLARQINILRAGFNITRRRKQERQQISGVVSVVNGNFAGKEA